MANLAKLCTKIGKLFANKHLAHDILPRCAGRKTPILPNLEICFVFSYTYVTCKQL